MEEEEEEDVRGRRGRPVDEEEPPRGRRGRPVEDEDESPRVRVPSHPHGCGYPPTPRPHGGMHSYGAGGGLRVASAQRRLDCVRWPTLASGRQRIAPWGWGLVRPYIPDTCPPPSVGLEMQASTWAPPNTHTPTRVCHWWPIAKARLSSDGFRPFSFGRVVDVICLSSCGSWGAVDCVE